MILLGVAGFARSGKDSFCLISQDILEKYGYKVKKYSFANALKRDVESFLRDVCGVDVWTADSELKKDIRDFLVWYGTTFWRKRDPDRWIRKVSEEIESDSNKYDIGLVSDVRYWNECDWVHTKYGTITDGWMVHVRSYELHKVYDQDDSYYACKYDEAPNEQERIHDPQLQEESDYKLEWEKQGIKNLDEVLNNTYLVNKVIECLKTCPYLNLTIPKQ